MLFLCFFKSHFLSVLPHDPCMALSYEWKKLMYFLLLFPEGIYSILIKNNLMIFICAIATNNIQMIEFISNNISKTEFVEIIGVVESLKS